jgi:hypothetical protein
VANEIGRGGRDKNQPGPSPPPLWQQSGIYEQVSQLARNEFVDYDPTGIITKNLLSLSGQKVLSIGISLSTDK